MGDLKTSGDPGKPPHPTTDSMVEWLARQPLGHSLPSMCMKDATHCTSVSSPRRWRYQSSPLGAAVGY